MSTAVGTITGRTVVYPLAKGTEPMTFTPEFKKAAGLVKADLSQVERRLAEDLCQRQDQLIRDKLASP